MGKALPQYKVYEEAGSHGRVRYDKGDVEFDVQWYVRDISGGDERRIFKRWTADEKTKDKGPEANRICMRPCSLALVA